MKKARHSTDAVFGLIVVLDTALGRRRYGIRPTVARHWADGLTAFGRQVRHSTDEKHGIRPTFDTAFDRRQAEWMKSLQAMWDKACSDSSYTQKQTANLFIIFI